MLGLGKTIQAIAFFWAILNKGGTLEDKKKFNVIKHRRRKLPHDKLFWQEDTDPRPLLIVLPSSLVTNWVTHKAWTHRMSGMVWGLDDRKSWLF